MKKTNVVLLFILSITLSLLAISEKSTSSATSNFYFDNLNVKSLNDDPSIDGEYWFGVYSTDKNGDVKFRYMYNFSYFYCSSWLPNLPFSDQIRITGQVGI